MNQLKMKLTNKLQFLIIFCILIYNKVKSERPCCPNNGTIQDLRKCKDGSNVSITCDTYPTMLNPNWDLYGQYIIGEDKDGEYLDAFIAGYSIHAPNYCTGLRTSVIYNRTLKVAVVCSSNRDWYRDQNLTGNEEAKEEARNLKIYGILTSVFNFFSGLALLTTAGIYFFLPDVQDTQGTCYFHFTFIAGIGHSTVTYMEIFDTEGLLPDLCIADLYLTVYLVLCGFAWGCVISFNTWRHTRNINCGNENKLLDRYKFFAYGVPTFLLFCAYVHVHVAGLRDEQSIISCMDHQRKVYQFYMAFPVLLALLLNFLMFFHCQIKIWNLHTIQLRDRKLMGKILKYRIFMNATLFFIMGTPWLLLILVQLLQTMVYSHIFFSYLEMFAALLVLGEGVPIFLILVVFRKRVLRGIANRWLSNTHACFDKWKTIHDSETEEESEDEREERGTEDSRKNLEVLFDNTNNSNHNNKTDHDVDVSPIVII